MTPLLFALIEQKLGPPAIRSAWRTLPNRVATLGFRGAKHLPSVAICVPSISA